MNHLSSCSEQPARNTTRLEYFKRRRTQLLNKQRKLKMLQHDLYDTLVKLQALLSGDASSPLEDKAARLAHHVGTEQSPDKELPMLYILCTL